MGTYIARRLLLMVPTLLGITLLVFLIVALAPGGIGAMLAAQGGAVQSQTSVALQRAYLEDRYGLDAPVLVQYTRWLGRISPLKFGARDQWGPGDERVRIPRAPREPVLWEWFADALPEAGPPAPPGDDLVAAYRVRARAHAEARHAYVRAATELEDALADWAEAQGVAGAVDRDNRLVVRALRRHGPGPGTPGWDQVGARARVAMDTLGATLQARADLGAVLREEPFPLAGLPIIPGLLSLDVPDFGTAYASRRPVIELIGTALPVTLLLNGIAFPIIYMIAVPAGMLAAVRRGSPVDTGLGVLFLALWSVPTVLAGVFAIGFLASRDQLGLFPVSGLHSDWAPSARFLPAWRADGWEPGYLLDMLWHVCLPVLCLVYGGFAILSKQMRAAMLENFSADYVRTAKAKGVPGRDIVLRHVLRNSLLPVITMFVTIFPAMLAGSVVIEKIFTVPGMGSLILSAIQERDRELLLANTVMVATVNLLALLLADILYALADPRVTYE